VTVRQRLTETQSTFAFAIGGGLTLLIIAYLLAAARGTALDQLLTIVGLLLVVAGSIGWFFFTRPWKDFDDWSTPLYTGHDHAHDHAHEHAESTHDAHGAEVEHGDVMESGVPAASVTHGGETVPGAATTAQVIAPVATTSAEPTVADPTLSEVGAETAGPAETFAATPAPEAPIPVAETPALVVPPTIVTVEETLAPNAEGTVKVYDAPENVSQDVHSSELLRITGIGPKIVAALNAAGIYTFSDMIARKPEELESIVRNAGVRMVGHADSWIEQARTALQSGTTTSNS
jgi:predicted flap endonuclease-1-like 5' DNA nuclease